MLQFLEVLTNENRMDFHNNFNCQNSLNKIKSVRKVNMIIITIALWGFLHLKSELIREAENKKTDKNHRKTVKYGSIFEGEITKQLKK